MNRTRLSEYIILSLSAYITLLAVYLILLPDFQTTLGRVLLTLFCLLFGILSGLFFRFENQLRIINLILVVMTAVLVAIFILSGYDFDTGILYFVLSAYAMLFLPVRNGVLWLVIFFLLVGFQGFLLSGWEDLPSLISFGGGFAFFGFVGASLRRSDAARHESDRLLGELQEVHKQLQEYAAQAEQLAVAEERNRLAREMHDALGHRLTVAVVQLEGAQRLIPTEPERAANMVATMREQLKTALHELRQTVSALRTPAEEDLPLPAAVQRLAANFQSATGLAVHVTLPANLPPLPAAHRQTLFRAVQECLTNIQRHADAQQVWLDLAVQNGVVALTVADDGKGFPPVIGEGHFGLEGLRERTEQLGGHVQWESRSEGGSQVLLQIPTGASAEAL